MWQKEKLFVKIVLSTLLSFCYENNFRRLFFSPDAVYQQMSYLVFRRFVVLYILCTVMMMNAVQFTWRSQTFIFLLLSSNLLKSPKLPFEKLLVLAFVCFGEITEWLSRMPLSHLIMFQTGVSASLFKAHCWCQIQNTCIFSKISEF